MKSFINGVNYITLQKFDVFMSPISHAGSHLYVIL